jgi:hypothetical protein
VNPITDRVTKAFTAANRSKEIMGCKVRNEQKKDLHSLREENRAS